MMAFLFTYDLKAILDRISGKDIVYSLSDVFREGTRSRFDGDGGQ